MPATTDLPANFNVSLHQMVQAIITVLAVINPVVCGSIFLTLTPTLAPAQRRWAAVRVALSILIILVASALIGLRALSVGVLLRVIAANGAHARPGAGRRNARSKVRGPEE